MAHLQLNLHSLALQAESGVRDVIESGGFAPKHLEKPLFETGRGKLASHHKDHHVRRGNPMSASNVSSPSHHLPFFARLRRVTTSVAAASLLASWFCLGCSVHPVRTAYVLAAAAALFAGGSYAFDIRFVPGRLPLFGNNRVLVRSLDDWTMYQYNLPFDQANAEQQSHALDHYKVGDRLFPARPQNAGQKQTAWQAGASMVTFCSFVTLTQAMRGWHRLYLFLVFYAWIFLCMRLSKRFSASAPPNALTGIGPL